MQNTSPNSPDGNHPHAEATQDAAVNPRQRYQSPEMLMTDDSLSDEQKHDLLSEWKLDLDNRLMAEEEGMGASDPMDRRHEARLADEHARVNTLLSDLAKALGRA